jgi:hypothetical protein
MHDPEKWVPVFPRDKREAFARRSCSNKKIERDDDSKKSHPALKKLLDEATPIPASFRDRQRVAVDRSPAFVERVGDRRCLLPRGKADISTATRHVRALAPLRHADGL